MIFLIIFCLIVNAEVIPPKYDDFDSYELIEQLILDQKYDLAYETLKNIDQKGDMEKNNFLFGKIFFFKSDFINSRKYLLQTRGVLRSESDLYLGEISYNEKKYNECINYLSKHKKIINIERSIILSHCFYEEKNYPEAWKILSFLKDKKAEKELILFNFKIGLQKEALNLAIKYLQKYNSSASECLALSQYFSGDEKIKILEISKAVHPFDVDINLAYAQVKYLISNFESAAEAFSIAALTEQKYYFHASEIYRQLGMIEISSYFNLFVEKNVDSIKLKMANLVESNNFLSIASMNNLVSKTKLMYDDEVRYALSYSLAQAGEYDKPTQYLLSITDQSILPKAVQLRKTLLECSEKRSSCSL